MADVNRTISISGEDAGTQQMIDRLRQSGSELFTELQDKAEAYSNKLDEQANRVQNLLQKEKDFQRQLIEEKRLTIELAAQAKMSAIDPSKFDAHEREARIIKEKRQAMEELNKEYNENRYVVGEASRLAQETYEKTGGAEGGGGGRAREAGRGALGVGVAVAAGAGMGALMGGLVSIISDTMGQAIATGWELAKEAEVSRMRIGAMTGRAAGHGAGTHLGMTAEEINDFAAQVATQRGLGANIISDVVSQLGVEQTLGMQAGALTDIEGFRRMGGEGSQQLMRDFLKKAAGSDLWNVGKGDFSRMTELMSDTNMLMGREMEIGEAVTPGRASNIMATIGSLGGKFESMTGSMFSIMDNAIRGGGGNEFLQAEIRSAISRPGMDLLDVETRVAQGMMNPETMADIIKRAKMVHRGQPRAQEIYLATLMPQLMADPSTRKRMLTPEFEDRLREMPPEAGEAEIRKLLSGRALAGGAAGPMAQMDVTLKEMAIGISEAAMTPLAETAIEALTEIKEWFEERGRGMDETVVTEAEKNAASDLNEAGRQNKEAAERFIEAAGKIDVASDKFIDASELINPGEGGGAVNTNKVKTAGDTETEMK